MKSGEMKKLFWVLVVFSILSLFVAPGMAQEEEEEEVGIPRIDEVLGESIDWPEGSTRFLDSRTGTLIVTNTPGNIKKIDALVKSLDILPMQVSIETRFIDIKTETLKDLGTEWTKFGVGGREPTRGRVDDSSSIGIDRLTGLTTKYLKLAIGATEGLGVTWEKFTDTEFKAILRALEKTGESDLLSAPRVTTLNGKPATVKVSKIYRFADDGSWKTLYYQYIAGVVPTSFEEPDEYGIVLTVTPEIGADKKTVTLTIDPEVSEWVGWQTFGTGTYTIMIEKVDMQNIKTRIVVEDGETVGMGGLSREYKKKVRARVPILGDIPLLGKLFGRDTDVREQRSLLIFTTVHILTPRGEWFRR
ncbi:type II secretion system protein GspD [bacterium]|nr:type II secretion system protein GspD [bacterium]